MRFCKIIAVFLLVTWLSSPAMAAIFDVHTDGADDVVTITIPKKGAYKVFTLANPDRLVIDVPAIGKSVSPELPDDYDGALIKKVRYGQFNPTTSRFVCELAGQVKVVETNEEGGRKFILSVRIKGQGALGAKARKKAKVPEKPVVVIDAGHGGVDPGALGAGRLQEKRLTLQYAKALREALLRTGKYKVVLTRETDQFILLRKRVELARKAGASIFISLHADSNPGNPVRGLSVYTLSENSSDAEAAKLAERENKADIISGVDLTHESSDVADILISLAQRDTMNQSSLLAEQIVRKSRGVIRVLPNPHRFAGFAVLKAPDIPSVLIELGFISNASEAKLLASSKYRDKVARTIANGVDAYFAHKSQTN